MSFLTKKERPRPQHAFDSDFPAAQLFILALVRVAEPIALTSILPYAWKLVTDFHIGSSHNAPFYAGLLVSAFSLAEALSGMYWGGVSDRIGRKKVIIFGCFGTLTSLLLVGLAPNFWVALAARFIGGALNGNIGVIQTVVGELVKQPEHEPKAYAVMPFVWSIGTIIGPSIGGYFAEPVSNFPSAFSPTGLFARFPYLLPNLICSSLLGISILTAHFFLEETHPNMRPQGQFDGCNGKTIESLFSPSQRPTATATSNSVTETYGTFSTVEVQHEEMWRLRSNGHEPEPYNSECVSTKTVVMFVIALGIFTYHSMTYDHLLPIFLQDKQANKDVHVLELSTYSLGGGLGLSTQNVGIIMSINGVIQLVVQAFVFPLVAELFGVWRLLIMVTMAHPIAYIVVPFLQLLPANLLYLGIFSCLTIRNVTSILAFPLLLIMIKEATPDKSHLGKINGLAASTGAACRTVASPVAGLLYGMSIDFHFTPLAWWTSAMVAICGAIQILLLNRAANDCTNRVHDALQRCSNEDHAWDEITHVTVAEGPRNMSRSACERDST